MSDEVVPISDKRYIVEPWRPPDCFRCGRAGGWVILDKKTLQVSQCFCKKCAKAGADEFNDEPPKPEPEEESILFLPKGFKR